jgi:hypothetical protein
MPISDSQATREAIRGHLDFGAIITPYGERDMNEERMANRANE